MLLEVKGVVIRAVNLSESDRIVTILTESHGTISAYANNSRSLKSRYMAAAQLFCYGSYVLYKKGDRFWVREVELIESFFGLRNSVERMALAAYFCEVLSDVTTADADPDVLRLTLNSLYAVANGPSLLGKIKAAFEMRLAALIGFMPDLDGCAECGRRDGVLYLDIMDGVAVCSECREYAAAERREGALLYSGEEARRAILILSEPVCATMRYVMSAPLERLLAFRVAEEDEASFEFAAEQYLLNHVESGYDTLKFYKDVIR